MKRRILLWLLEVLQDWRSVLFILILEMLGLIGAILTGGWMIWLAPLALFFVICDCARLRQVLKSGQT